jgi:hypothetical protein
MGDVGVLEEEDVLGRLLQTGMKREAAADRDEEREKSRRTGSRAWEGARREIGTGCC